MKESPYPLEHTLGMRWYASNTPGTGGRLRESAEDFVVDEIPAETGTEGAHLICRLTKKDWELQRAVREIAKQLSISHRRIGWTGTKDKHALTTQLISIQGIEEGDLSRIRLRDLELVPVGRSASPLALGSHQANRFSITIRNTSSPDLPSIAAAVSETCTQGLPNFFGIQRFGVIRPITHLVGEKILEGNIQGAVDCYVGAAFPDEPDDVREARTAYYEEGDPLRALRALPVPLTYERAMLHHLVSHPGDYRGALLSLPPRLLSMFVSAFQSFLFNVALSARMERDPEFYLPHHGDRLIFADGRDDVVTEGTLTAALMQVRRGRCRIAIMMPGSRDLHEKGEDDCTISSILTSKGIDHESFSTASTLVHTRYDGALRPVSLTTDIKSTIEGSNLNISFSLPPGQYATTVCREFMKADPRDMI